MMEFDGFEDGTGVQQRYMLIREVVDPVNWEAQQIASGARRWPHSYDYAKEPFRVVVKEFWALHHLPRVKKHFIPTLLHENDGLILQVRQHC
jgi:mRNA-capping enzyme